MVFSSEIRVGKPLRAYYEKLVSICGAIPEESVFVDDLEANVRAAEEIGMQGFVFKGDAQALRSFIYGRV
jgi:putative hydrolase of the HAD superfamily